MKKNSLNVMTVQALSRDGTITTLRQGGSNIMTLPCVTAEPAYAGQACITFTIDGQQTVVIGTGGYIVP